jgi:hypothetical protein
MLFDYAVFNFLLESSLNLSLSIPKRMPTAESLSSNPVVYKSVNINVYKYFRN